jgi:hypothetical protein
VSAGAPATGAADGLVLLVDDDAVADLPGGGRLAAVVCTAGDEDASLAEAARDQQVPCVLGVRFDGGEPDAGTLLVVDCSGQEGVVRVVDGGIMEGGLEDVVATQDPPGVR